MLKESRAFVQRFQSVIKLEELFKKLLKHFQVAVKVARQVVGQVARQVASLTFTKLFELKNFIRKKSFHAVKAAASKPTQDEVKNKSLNFAFSFHLQSTC